MNYKYPVYQPDLSGNEKKYINECIDSSWISSKGRFVKEFEYEFSRKIGVEYSTSVCNGTVALHLAMIVLGLGPGDEVIVPTFTYIASVNAIRYVGATPIFVDSDSQTWQMSLDDIKKKTNQNTKAILAVHIYGHPCDMVNIKDFAKEKDLFLIEDCAEAIGAKVGDKNVGTFGDLSTYSFFGNKTITTGEGGMLVTNDKTLIDRAEHYKGQGLAKYREYWHDVIGYNFRMTNVAAAIGLAQLERIDEILYKKRKIAEWYKELIKHKKIYIHQEKKGFTHSYWMVSILTENSENRDKMRIYLKEKGIETRPTFYPVHTMPMYTRKFEKHLNAENIGWRGMNLPSYPQLEFEDVKYISNIINSVNN